MVKRREFGPKRGSKFAEDDEDDIIYVQEALLPAETNDNTGTFQNPAPAAKEQKRPDRVLITGSLWAAFFALGMCFALPGPTLPDLQTWTNTNTEQVSLIFAGRAAGYLLGSLVSGLLFDRLSQSCLLSMALLMTAVATAVVPWCVNAALLISAISLQGIAMGCLDTGGNLLHVQIWGRASGDGFYVQRLLFGFGAFIGPLLTESFVYHPHEISDMFENHFTQEGDHTNNSFGKNSSATFSIVDQTMATPTTEMPNATDVNELYTWNNGSGIEKHKSDKVSGPFTDLGEEIWDGFEDMSFVHYAYFIVAGFCLLVSILLVVSWCQGERGKLRPKEDQDDFRYQSGAEKKSKVALLILLFTFFLLEVGMEVTVGGFLASYSLKYLKWPAVHGVLLTSTFWGSLAITRVVALVLARCITPTFALSVDLVTVLLALSALVVVANMNNIAVWVCTAVLGVGMASVVPAGLYWAERHMTITGKESAVIVIASAMGEMVLPPAAGFIFQNNGPIYIMYLLMSAAMLNIIVFILLQNIGTHVKERENRRNDD